MLTIFEPKNIVWVMVKGKAKKCIVHSVRISTTKGIEYTLHHQKTGKIFVKQHYWIFESKTEVLKDWEGLKNEIKGKSVQTRKAKKKRLPKVRKIKPV